MPRGVADDHDRPVVELPVADDGTQPGLATHEKVRVGLAQHDLRTGCNRAKARRPRSSAAPRSDALRT
jgi:hypothetical protein